MCERVVSSSESRIALSPTFEIKTSSPSGGLKYWLTASDWNTKLSPSFGSPRPDPIRQGLSDPERAAHDEAWGIDFGEPGTIALTPFEDNDAEHPMSANMAPKLGEAIDADPTFLAPRADGATMLHDMALGGSAASVEVSLAKGADPAARRADGKTAADLAEAMGWAELAQRLRVH